ncbi:MAG TPA: 5-oxoprolinase subunit PxpB [Gaiellaceae bacterium]|jgi:KipI family sensor histidine kinase inhibitor|nr:5-oxoprolinase subunit PxpB [Gaiellaceae bacterium]
MTASIRPAGDRGALIEVADSAAAISVARALTGRPDLVDIVPGHRTVLVTWRGAGPPPDLDGLVTRALEVGPAREEGRTVEIPVVYDGPDLDEVARLVSLSPEDVATRHAAAEYTVAFLGFAPGFAYLLGGDERLQVPRLSHPRERVAAGSVAIAGPYSGVYPRASPGGWRLLGHTSLLLFDPARPSPALLASGDRVRFVRE